MLVSKVKNIVGFVLKKLPTRKIILFESAPDLSDNTKPVFDELIRRGYNKKYKFIWMCFDKGHYGQKEIENVKYLSVEKHRAKVFLLNYLARVTICCNRFLGVERKEQSSFYLMHGSPLKDSSSYYVTPKSIDFIITQSPCFDKLNKKSVPENKELHSLGFARNDDMIKNNVDLAKLFGKFKKYVVWYPTVKQFKNGQKTGCVQPIQFISSLEEAKQINSIAKKENVLIILKPHFAQIVDDLKDHKLSNIVFINDEFFKINNITSYEFVGSCDALLTDYSSIYYDFLLVDKPIGLIWTDIDEYKKDPGLVEGYEYFCSGGYKIKSIEDFAAFLSFSDVLKEERDNIRKAVHPFKQETVTASIVDFIVKNGSL